MNLALHYLRPFGISKTVAKKRGRKKTPNRCLIKGRIEQNIK